MAAPIAKDVGSNEKAMAWLSVVEISATICGNKID
jgi:hypothetical protein